jgi:hypothetical protein
MVQPVLAWSHGFRVLRQSRRRLTVFDSLLLFGAAVTMGGVAIWSMVCSMPLTSVRLPSANRALFANYTRVPMIAALHRQPRHSSAER